MNEARCDASEALVTDVIERIQQVVAKAEEKIEGDRDAYEGDEVPEAIAGVVIEMLLDYAVGRDAMASFLGAIRGAIDEFYEEHPGLDPDRHADRGAALVGDQGDLAAMVVQGHG